MSKLSLNICFVTDGEPFHGASPEEKALGGSETALVQVARALAQLGHKVMVFCRCPKPGWYHNVLYRDRKDLVAACCEERFDVLVVSRFFAALDLPIQASLRVLWNHDILDKPSALRKRLDKVDICLVLSSFHAQDYSLRLPECSSKLITTRNGLDLDFLGKAQQGVERVKGRMIYVSRPERGLLLLLDRIWLRLKKALPHLTLDICGYEVNTTEIHPKLKAQYEEINDLIKTMPDVNLLGGLAKQDYYRHLASCEMLLYPCVFPEISCIAALEAQASGTPCITSSDYALRETVSVPLFLIPHKPGSSEYIDSFIQKVIDLYENLELREQAAKKAKEAVWAKNGWSTIAQEWEELFLQSLKSRLNKQKTAVAAGLILHGGQKAASKLLDADIELPEEGLAPEDPQEKTLLTACIKAVKSIGNKMHTNPLVGVFSADMGRSVSHMRHLEPKIDFCELKEDESPNRLMDVVFIRDLLERSEHPEKLLKLAIDYCKPQGHLLLCVATGAWPLFSPGYLARKHDLGKKQILELLPERQVGMTFLPRGKVGQGHEGLFAGRILAIAPALGPKPRDIDLAAMTRQMRPLGEKYLKEVISAGLI